MKFNPEQLATVNEAVATAEELVSNHFKLSASQWLKRKYDVKTAADLIADEVIEGPFAQVIRYEGRVPSDPLNSSSFDFYKICLQDHNILRILQTTPHLTLFPFALYIVTHELIHIVRFSQFLQNFEASNDERLAEEKRVHDKTHEILCALKIDGLAAVLNYYARWRDGFDDLRC
ncbi:MAG: hypothetical protein QNJ61_07415 [Desulfobacterales bacterium]|nr:hypothetical protein [Desulfobacterales bacterium]